MVRNHRAYRDCKKAWVYIYFAFLRRASVTDIAVPADREAEDGQGWEQFSLIPLRLPFFSRRLAIRFDRARRIDATCAAQGPEKFNTWSTSTLAVTVAGSLVEKFCTIHVTFALFSVRHGKLGVIG